MLDLKKLHIQDRKMQTEDLTKNAQNHGGKRQNSGRKAYYQEKTVVMRVPESKVAEIKAQLRTRPKDDRDKNIDLQPVEVRTALEIASIDSLTTDIAYSDYDNQEHRIDLNEYLIHNPLSTFVMRVNSHAMQDAGLTMDDEILIDRSLSAQHGDIVLAVIHDEFTVKRLMQEKQKNGQAKIWLKAENADYPDYYLQSEEQLMIYGVITCVLKKLR